MCAHASRHTCMCTHTMHTGLITLANMIHSPMNVLHTPDMEPISVRNKPEYLSTAAGCKPWRIKYVLPKPGCSFIRIIKFLKGLVFLPGLSIYIYCGRGGRYQQEMLRYNTEYLHGISTVRKHDTSSSLSENWNQCTGQKKNYDNVAFTLSSCCCLDASCELNYIKFARNGVSVLYRWYP